MRYGDVLIVDQPGHHAQPAPFRQCRKNCLYLYICVCNCRCMEGDGMVCLKIREDVIREVCFTVFTCNCIASFA